MTIEEFDEAIRLATDGVRVDFGGFGADEVFCKLPQPLRDLYQRWNIPVAILANRNRGPGVRLYAEACGIPVAADLAALTKQP